MKSYLLFISFSLLFLSATAQNKIEWDGQVSAIGSYSPANDLEAFVGVRYIPELNYSISLDTIKTLDFETSANLSSSLLFHPFSEGEGNSSMTPYRIWARYSSKQFELRVGLQKIDFGSATLLRPIQWFNQIDPRDPLQLTNGVYGILGRYYFLNNANIWAWVLYGNEKTRGFDAIETNRKIPEFGGRIQHPVTNGELALSYHHRTASTENLAFVPQFEEIPENRIGIDGKWDVGIGLWFETTFIHKNQNVGIFTNQTLLNIGSDYTFGLGNGLNVMMEHLITSFDETAFAFENTAHVTALTAAYPIGFFDNISSVFYYSWASEDAVFLVNYEHQFQKTTGYFMLYYNPNTLQGIQQNDLVNQFSGAGLRVMLVFNY